MRKLSLSVAIALLSNSAYANYMLAESKSMGISVSVVDKTEQSWCSDNVSLSLSGNTTQENLDVLLPKVLNLVKTQCSTAKKVAFKSDNAKGHFDLASDSVVFDKKEAIADKSASEKVELDKKVEAKSDAKKVKFDDEYWLQLLAYRAKQSDEYMHEFKSAYGFYYYVTNKKMLNESELNQLTSDYLKALPENITIVYDYARLVKSADNLYRPLLENHHVSETLKHEMTNPHNSKFWGDMGIYESARHSRYAYILPNAKEFARWIAHEDNLEVVKKLSSKVKITIELTLKPTSVKDGMVVMEYVSALATDGQNFWSHDIKAAKRHIRYESYLADVKKYEQSLRNWEYDKKKYLERNYSLLKAKFKNPVIFQMANDGIKLTNQQYLYQLAYLATEKGKHDSAWVMINIEGGEVVWPSKYKTDGKNGWQVAFVNVTKEGKVVVERSVACEESLCKDLVTEEKVKELIESSSERIFLESNPKPVEPEAFKEEV